MGIYKFPGRKFKIILSELQGTQMDNSMKSGKQYMAQMRVQQNSEIIKRNQIDILELKNTMNEFFKCSRELQQFTQLNRRNNLQT